VEAALTPVDQAVVTTYLDIHDATYNRHVVHEDVLPAQIEYAVAQKCEFVRAEAQQEDDAAAGAKAAVGAN
jgi:hypothetical protein